MAFKREHYHDAEKHVFAVDLVMHVLDEEWPRDEPRSRDINNYWQIIEKVYPNFTYNVRKAVDKLRQTLGETVSRDFEMMRENDALDERAFLRYVDRCVENFFPQGFNPLSLLKFSVSIALLAGHLLNLPEVKIENLPELVCKKIVERFPFADMDYELRTKLDEAAERYAQE